MLPQDLYIKELSKVCLHGSDVVNPYTGQRMYISCGTCPTCLYKKAVAKSIRCSVQKELSTYCYFGTLTYSQRYVPKYVISKLEDSDEIYVFNGLPRPDGEDYEGLDKDNSFSAVVRMSPEIFKTFTSQASLNIKGRYPELQNVYGNLNRRDFQLFMKRLRFYIKSKIGKYEKIHSYVVGEYGPKSFRPHFHFILCFDNPAVSQILREACSSAWSYGRIDLSIARKDATSYVAGYVNSFTRLPFCLREIPSIKPFSRFSNGYANDLFISSIARVQRFRREYRQLDREGFKELFADFVDGFPFIVNERLLSVRPWRSVVDSCFFRLAANPSLSVSELRTIAQSVYEVYTRYSSGTRSPSALGFANWLYDLLYVQLDGMSRYDYYHGKVIPFLDDLLFYCRSVYSHFTSDSHKKLFVGQVYRLTLQVLRFLRTVPDFFKCKNYICLDSALQLSKDYFNHVDYCNLTRSLEFVEDTEDDILDFYLTPTRFNINFFVNNHPLVRGINDYALVRCDNQVKHREINDINFKFYGE